MEAFFEKWSLFLPVPSALVGVSPSAALQFSQDQTRGAKLSTEKPGQETSSEKCSCRICENHHDAKHSLTLGSECADTVFAGKIFFHVSIPWVCACLLWGGASFQAPHALHLGFCSVMPSPLFPLLVLLVLMDWFLPLERNVLC